MKPRKPLLLRDLMLTGKAYEGILDVRVMDGAKLASKRLNIVEVKEVYMYLRYFLEEYKRRNHYNANVSELARDDD